MKFQFIYVLSKIQRYVPTTDDGGINRRLMEIIYYIVGLPIFCVYQMIETVDRITGFQYDLVQIFRASKIFKFWFLLHIRIIPLYYTLDEYNVNVTSIMYRYII
jgi:hypothetical protein